MFVAETKELENLKSVASNWAISIAQVIVVSELAGWILKLLFVSLSLTHVVVRAESEIIGAVLPSGKDVVF